MLFFSFSNFKIARTRNGALKVKNCFWKTGTNNRPVARRRGSAALPRLNQTKNPRGGGVSGF